VNETSEDHERSGTENILKKIKERDIKGKINLSNTERQHKLGALGYGQNHNFI
jgi:helix-turn-helix protein